MTHCLRSFGPKQKQEGCKRPRKSDCLASQKFSLQRIKLHESDCESYFEVFHSKANSLGDGGSGESDVGAIAVHAGQQEVAHYWCAVRGDGSSRCSIPYTGGREAQGWLRATTPGSSNLVDSVPEISAAGHDRPQKW